MSTSDRVRTAADSAGRTNGHSSARAGRPATAMALFAALFAATPAAASDGELIRRFGLVGAWAVDCGKDPGGGNPYLIFRVTPEGGAVRELIMRNSSADGRFALTGVTPVSANRIAFRDRRTTGGTGHDVVMQLDNGQLRSISSVTESGQRLIDNGILSSSGQPSLTFRRCAREPTA